MIDEVIAKVLASKDGEAVRCIGKYPYPYHFNCEMVAAFLAVISGMIKIKSDKDEGNH